MKKIIVLFNVALLFCTTFIFAQQKTPYSFNHHLKSSVPQVIMPERDFTKDIADAIAFEEAGNYPIFGHLFDLNLTLNNAGVWTNLENGDRVWRLNLKSIGALASAFFFENFYLPEGSSFHAYSIDKTKLHSYGFENNQGNDLFSTEFITTDEQILEYYEPAAVKGIGRMRITAMSHQFRSIKLAGACEVNIICSPEGNNWQDEKKGVCRILVVSGSQQGYCTGTLMNNTSLDCKRYILTAWHCGQQSSAANFNQYVFRFNYEATSCAGSDTEGTTTNQFTGCTNRANSNDNGGATGSDFLLLEMTATTSPSWWAATAYFNGWTRATTSTAGGVGIHHPTGSNKKISTFTNTPGSISWGGSVPSTHWEIKWIATANDWGVTEGGSSGSAAYNNAGLVFGTLTGGNSACNNQTAGDAYGKMSYHWTSNGTTANRQLKPWLDPGNTGATTLASAYTICATGINTIALQKAITIYPNPNSGIFNISFNNYLSENIKVRIVNVIGQEIKNFKIEQSTNTDYTVDLSNQSNGIYFIEVNNNGVIASEKIIVSK